VTEEHPMATKPPMDPDTGTHELLLWQPMLYQLEE